MWLARCTICTLFRLLDVPGDVLAAPEIALCGRIGVLRLSLTLPPSLPPALPLSVSAPPPFQAVFVESYPLLYHESVASMETVYDRPLHTSSFLSLLFCSTSISVGGAITTIVTTRQTSTI